MPRSTSVADADGDVISTGAPHTQVCPLSKTNKHWCYHDQQDSLCHDAHAASTLVCSGFLLVAAM
eukprot:10340591-Alexandrium_andersonii.AAC.1